MTHKGEPNGTHAHDTALGLATRAIHVGSEPENSVSNGVSPSIDMSTTYLQTSVGVHKGFEYSRSSNPTRLALERVLSSLEGADVLLSANLAAASIDPATFSGGPAAISLASGSAASSLVISGLTGPQGHVISVGDVYGGTSRYMLRVAGEQQRVETTFVDMSYGQGEQLEAVDGENEAVRRGREDLEIYSRVKNAVKPNTKMIWAETPTNPMLSLVPISIIAKVAKEEKIPLVIDNTFASPYYQNPLALGADIVVHSITKYIGGHSDVVGGVVITPDIELLKKFRFLQNAYGSVPSPFDCWLVIRSIKTLPLRLQQHGLNALSLANWLQTIALPSGLIRDVNYPGLKRAQETLSQQRERELAWDQLSSEAKRWVVGLGYTRDGEGGFPFGGMLSFHIVGPSESSQELSSTAERFLERLELFALAESLGGVESLAELPMLMTHSGVDKEKRRHLGIDGELVRLSVGVEDVVDLRMDVERALKAAVVRN